MPVSITIAKLNENQKEFTVRGCAHLIACSQKIKHTWVISVIKVKVSNDLTETYVRPGSGGT